jgi:hydrogenase-4 membrane subunit HyfE
MSTSAARTSHPGVNPYVSGAARVSPIIVGIHNGNGVRAECIEQFLLGAKVFLHRIVVVEMVLREIREHGRTEAKPFYP